MDDPPDNLSQSITNYYTIQVRNLAKLNLNKYNGSFPNHLCPSFSVYGESSDVDIT